MRKVPHGSGPVFLLVGPHPFFHFCFARSLLSPGVKPLGEDRGGSRQYGYSSSSFLKSIRLVRLRFSVFCNHHLSLLNRFTLHGRLVRGTRGGCGFIWSHVGLVRALARTFQGGAWPRWDRWFVSSQISRRLFVECMKWTGLIFLIGWR